LAGRPQKLVTATTAAAATAAAHRASEGRLLARPDRREDGELAPHVDGAAVGAGRLLAVSDELLEVRLALHADVLVDRHRRTLTEPFAKSRGDVGRELLQKAPLIVPRRVEDEVPEAEVDVVADPRDDLLRIVRDD